MDRETGLLVWSEGHNTATSSYQWFFSPSLIAMQLQQMAGKLGIVHRKDLAQTTAHHLPKWLRYTLWIVIELALMATDLAEVIGSGIAPPPSFWLALAFFHSDHHL